MKTLSRIVAVLILPGLVAEPAAVRAMQVPSCRASPLSPSSGGVYFLEQALNLRPPFHVPITGEALNIRNELSRDVVSGNVLLGGRWAGVRRLPTPIPADGPAFDEAVLGEIRSGFQALRDRSSREELHLLATESHARFRFVARCAAITLSHDDRRMRDAASDLILNLAKLDPFSHVIVIQEVLYWAAAEAVLDGAAARRNFEWLYEAARKGGKNSRTAQGTRLVRQLVQSAGLEALRRWPAEPLPPAFSGHVNRALIQDIHAQVEKRVRYLRRRSASSAVAHEREAGLRALAPEFSADPLTNAAERARSILKLLDQAGPELPRSEQISLVQILLALAARWDLPDRPLIADDVISAFTRAPSFWGEQFVRGWAGMSDVSPDLAIFAERRAAEIYFLRHVDLLGATSQLRNLMTPVILRVSQNDPALALDLMKQVRMEKTARLAAMPGVRHWLNKLQREIQFHAFGRGKVAAVSGERSARVRERRNYRSIRLFAAELRRRAARLVDRREAAAESREEIAPSLGPASIPVVMPGEERRRQRNRFWNNAAELGGDPMPGEQRGVTGSNRRTGNVRRAPRPLPAKGWMQDSFWREIQRTIVTHRLETDFVHPLRSYLVWVLSKLDQSEDSLRLPSSDMAEIIGYPSGDAVEAALRRFGRQGLITEIQPLNRSLPIQYAVKQPEALEQLVKHLGPIDETDKRLEILDGHYVDRVYGSDGPYRLVRGDLLTRAEQVRIVESAHVWQDAGHAPVYFRPFLRKLQTIFLSSRRPGSPLPRIWFVLSREDRLLGFIHLELNEILAMEVAPAYRRRGIASELLAHAAWQFLSFSNAETLTIPDAGGVEGIFNSLNIKYQKVQITEDDVFIWLNRDQARAFFKAHQARVRGREKSKSERDRGPTFYTFPAMLGDLVWARPRVAWASALLAIALQISPGLAKTALLVLILAPAAKRLSRSLRPQYTPALARAA